MCGICGVLNFDGTPVTLENLNQINDQMIMRGPDDSGHYIKDNFGMAMRRLSIIDMDSGHQPIANSNGTINVVFNGEIYNYIELRKKLEQKGYEFSTNSDTEVLIHLYEEYGLDSVDYLNGMFAFSIWDNSIKRLWVVRDRIGIKPLVYFINDNQFVFASTLSALKKHPNFHNKIDNESLLLYLTMAYVPSPRTIWENTKKLQPGHWLLIENGTVKIKSYWTIKSDSTNNISRNSFLNKISSIFSRSIEIQSRSDVPVGTFLSGGIDSGAVTSHFSNRSINTVDTFTMDFKGKIENEGDPAQIIAKSLKIRHHLHNLTINEALEELDQLLPLMDEPLGDSAIIPSYVLSKMAREHGIKVVLCGAGGDELFGGYSRHYKRLRDYIAGSISFLPLKLVNSLSIIFGAKVGHYFSVAWDKGLAFGLDTSGIHIGLLRKIINEPYHYNKAINLTKNQFKDINKLEKKWGFGYSRMLVDMQNYLVDNVLAITDKTSMATSIEARVPLLDHRLAEFSFSVSDKINLSSNFNNAKLSLKDSIGALLPKEILSRPKIGFNAPVNNWIKSGHSKLEERITNPKSLELKKLLNTDMILKIWSNKKLRSEASENLFIIYILDIWLESNGQ